MKPYILSKEVIVKLEAEEFEINVDYKRRDQLLGLSMSWEQWNAQHNNQHTAMKFENLSVEQLEQLLIENFVEPDSGLIGPPSEKEILLFMSKFPSVKAYGSVGNPTSPKHSDYSLWFEGLYVEGIYVTQQLREDFMEFCESADELSDDEDGLFSWWD